MPSGIWMQAYWLLWIMLLLNSALIILLVRQVAGLYAAFMKNDPAWGLPLGVRAPTAAIQDVFGKPVQLMSDGNKTTVILFLSAGCSSCLNVVGMLPTISANPDLNTVVVIGADETKTRLFIEPYNPTVAFPNVAIVADPKRMLAEQYQVATVPYATIVDGDGIVGAKGVPASITELATYVQRAVNLREKRGSRDGHDRMTQQTAHPLPVEGG
jgi:hypothetical protein